jgi:hypothetical protein
MKKIFTFLTIALLSFEAYSQGCVAIRSTGGVCTMAEHLHGSEMSSSKWIFGANTRYFKSFRHYKGDVEQKERLELGTEVINHQYALGLTVTRNIDKFWSAMVDVPLQYNARSSLYEHGRTERRSMHSYGIGDVRLAAYRWLIDPEKSSRLNIQAGLGFKVPTGKKDYKDYWHNVGENGAKELRTVDQSIQLGDGGFGVSAELNAFFNLMENLGVYGNFYYLSNPREENGVRTYREKVSETLYNETIMSVADQYMARAGVNYSFSSFVASAGARVEGIPVYDLIGGSGGFRRPGYVWSVEPALTYQVNKVQLYATVPVALYRNRTQSVTDKERSVATNTFVQGDAAFADYSINLGVSFRF